MAIAQKIFGMHDIKTSARGVIQTLQILQFGDCFSMVQSSQSLHGRCDCQGTFLEQLLSLGPVIYITKS